MAPTLRTQEEARAFLEAGEESAKLHVQNGAISVVAGTGRLRRYADLLADVRHDGRYHPIRSLVQPVEPEVKEVARVLAQASDFIGAAQEFVHSFTTYRYEVGDYWAKPQETLAARAGDCDDKGILLCSLLRNYILAEKVYCAFGLWFLGGEPTGHLWVVIEGEGGEDRILEATAPPTRAKRGKYVLYGMFNDLYAFATDIGLSEFDLKPVALEEMVARR